MSSHPIIDAKLGSGQQAVVVLGPDLQIVVEGTSTGPRARVTAFDSDGNELSVTAEFIPAPVTTPIYVTAAIAAAIHLYPDHYRGHPSTEGPLP